MSPTARSGDTDWRADSASLDERGPRESGQVLRILAVVPFVLAGAVGVIAGVSWLLVVVLGIGTSRGSVFRWAGGRSLAEALPQIALLLVLGAICIGFVLASVWAALTALRPTQPAWFWPLTEGLWALAGGGLLAIAIAAQDSLVPVGLSSRDLYFAIGIVALSLIVTDARRRMKRRPGAGGGRDA